MAPITRTLLPLLLLTAIGGCQRDSEQPDTSTKAISTAKTPAAHVAFQQAEQAWRDERRANLLKPDGWTSLIGLHWIESGAHYVGSAADNGIRLTMGPAQLGMLERKAGHIRLVPNKAVALTLDGQSLQAAATLKADADEGGPSVLAFDDGKGAATVIKRGERYALRVKHAEAPSRTQFAGLEYWPADPSWKVDATFVPHPPGKTIPIASIIGTVDEVPNPGAIQFQRDGKTYRIEALDEGGDSLFLIVADRTNGHGSYGAGRYIDAPKADAQGHVVVDFNQAYNPPCAFTAFATCPLPPPENRLDLAITAGEKAYAKSAH